MDFGKPDKDCRNGLRITPKEQTEIISELEERASRNKPSEKRVDERLRYVQNALIFLQVRHPGGTTSNYMVRSRNLSKAGIGFLHGSFIYTGTPCSVWLKNTENKLIELEGTAVRCSHVRGHIHDIGVKFARPVNLRNFVGNSVAGDVSEPTTELPKLKGYVLHIDDSPDEQELLKFHLDSLGVRVKAVSSGLEAMEAIAAERFNLVISGLWLPGVGGSEIARLMRQCGFKGPMISLSADERAESRLAAIKQGCTAVLNKPYNFENLLPLLVRYLRPAGGPPAADVISTRWSDRNMRPLISRFLNRLDTQMRQIQSLIGSADNAQITQKLCMDLKGSAGGYGFPAISKASGTLLELLMKRAGTKDVVAQVEELASICASCVQALPETETEKPATPPAPAAQ